MELQNPELSIRPADEEYGFGKNFSGTFETLLRQERDTVPKMEEKSEKKFEILYDGYYYDVTEFAKRHPGGDVINLYKDGDDATIPIQQFHYRSLKTVMAKMKGLSRRPATDVNNNLEPSVKSRHDELTKDFLKLFKEIEAEGIMKAEPLVFGYKMFQNFVLFVIGLIFVHLFGVNSLICRGLGIIFITFAGGQFLWQGHEGGHNSFTGIPKLDRIGQIFSYGVIYGMSASSWNYTHTEHHAMPQHETKDADLKTLPLIAFNQCLLRNGRKPNFWMKYQHLLFVLCDTFIVVQTWKLNHHIKFAWKNRCYGDLICMAIHYALVPILGGVTNWLIITWLSSIYILGNLILSHTHYPVVKEGQKLHWVEYAFIYTTNVRSSWWVDWWMGQLNNQIEHHLFPTMPQYKGKLIRNKVKAFAKRHGLPYQLCSYWEAVQTAYNNLENVASEIRQM
ncbi:Fatty acid desaturase 3 [Orchesella cincta]|uniref:Fatty acid desaturase 3 n=1 Tax=Orchesella cincta TaxID=48709 RepID=A0A1D2MAZ5_ORCCI|nr:Fatty acid desaturase 3 [Orchesella cincta]